MININSVRATSTGAVEFASECGNIMVRHTLAPEQADKLAEELTARARDARVIDRVNRDAAFALAPSLLGFLSEEVAMKAEIEVPAETPAEKPKVTRKPRQTKATPVKASRPRVTRGSYRDVPALKPPTRTRQPRGIVDPSHRDAIPANASATEPGTVG